MIMTDHETYAETSIADRAMLVSVTLRQFSTTKTDKKIGEEVATAHGADSSMGRYAKSVIAKSAIEAIRTLAGEIRQEHYRRTLPWSEDGARILTSTGFTEYAEFMRRSEIRWNRAVDEFVENYDRYVREAQAKLGTMFKESDYPDAGSVRGKFEFRSKVNPVPTGDDFRVNLSADHLAVIRGKLQADLDATVKTAMADVWTRMKDVVGRMAERLKGYDPKKPSDAPFRESLVTNVKELLAILPSLNLNEDPAIDVFIEEMKELVKFSAQELRDNTWKRNETQKRAEAILDQMTQFVA